MKTFIRGRKITREVAGFKVYGVEMEAELPKVGLSMKYKLKVEPDGLLDNVNAELIDIAEEKLNDTPLVYMENGSQYAVTKYQLATLVADCMFTAIENVSKTKDVFTCYVDEAKDVLREYLKENKAAMDKLEEMKEKGEKIKQQKDEFDVLMDELKILKKNLQSLAEAPVQSGQVMAAGPMQMNAVSQPAKAPKKKAQPRTSTINLGAITLEAYNPNEKRSR